ncbi:hypothetical protein [Rheinheimera faecalis]
MLASKAQIKADRLRMNNPYAHLDEDGGLSALLPDSRLGSGQCSRYEVYKTNR